MTYQIKKSSQTIASKHSIEYTWSKNKLQFATVSHVTAFDRYLNSYWLKAHDMTSKLKAYWLCWPHPPPVCPPPWWQRLACLQDIPQTRAGHDGSYTRNGTEDFRQNIRIFLWQ